MKQPPANFPILNMDIQTGNKTFAYVGIGSSNFTVDPPPTTPELIASIDF
jgi:hypothetical protein